MSICWGGVTEMAAGSDSETKKLKVHYSGGLNQELDKAIETCLKEFGYQRWASGMDLHGIRDLAFDNRK